jgi:hypothetical protein
MINNVVLTLEPNSFNAQHMLCYIIPGEHPHRGIYRPLDGPFRWTYQKRGSEYARKENAAPSSADRRARSE